MNANLSRICENEEDDREKYTLSLSILNFLKCSSNAPLMQIHLMDRDALVKEILMKEDRNSSSNIKTIPIDIENSFMCRSI